VVVRVSFWQEHCPVRGVGLTHVKSMRCGADHRGHSMDQCCECLARASDLPLITTNTANATPKDPWADVKVDHAALTDDEKARLVAFTKRALERPR
jgi:hypothetical protein